ncbi:hypothetical protein THAOC_19354, partial [Thalassiosira oceanica]
REAEKLQLELTSTGPTTTSSYRNSEDNGGHHGAGYGRQKPAPAASKAKLSSSTLGMRFMQRKRNADKDGQEEMRTAAARKKEKSTTLSVSNTASDDPAAHCQSDSRKRQFSTQNDLVRLELASVSDMYGIDIVGRRSFGGYRKCVKSTWETALSRRNQDERRQKISKHHITDDELLDRYEMYVKQGRNGGNNMDSRRKEKRKRN